MTLLLIVNAFSPALKMEFPDGQS